MTTIKYILGEDYSTKYPKLEIGERGGETGYIDFIKPSEVKYPIVQGVDKFNRPFFCIHLKGLKGEKEITFFQTFFQRYSDNNDLWHGAGHYGTQPIETSGGMDDDTRKDLKNIVQGETITPSRLTSDNYSNLRLMTQEEVDTLM